MGTSNQSDKVLYECECFRVVRYEDDQGKPSVSLSFYQHGIDLYMTLEEFEHFVEALSELDTVSVKECLH